MLRRLASPWAAVVAALALAAAAYGPALDGPFQFDDWTSIETHFALRDPARLLAALRPESLLGPERPLTDLSFALDLAAAGLDPFAFHRTGLLLHLAAAVLAFLLLRALLRRAGHPRAGVLAALAAGAFAVLPLHAQAVLYAAQRAEVLSSLLALAALLLLLGAEARRGAVAWGLAALAALAFLLALAAKTVVVAVPAAFLLVALLPGAAPPGAQPVGRRLGRALALAAPLLALAALSVARNLTVLSADRTAGLSAGVGPWRYLLTQLSVHWRYAGLLVWPAGLSVDPDVAASGDAPSAATLAALLATLAALGAAVLLARAAARHPGAPAAPAARAGALGVAWWYLLLLPTSSVVPLADLAADHRPYLASLGALLALAVLGDHLLARAAAGRDRLRAGLGATLGAAALLALALGAAARAQVWTSTLSLWSDAAEKAPGRFRPALNHAFALAKARRTAEAEREYLRAQGLARGRREVASVARNLSALYFDTGRLESAVAAADVGLAADGHDPEVRLNRAGALLRLGRGAEALDEARRAVSIAPGNPHARDVLGLALRASGDFPAALRELRTAARIDPADPRWAIHELETLDLVAGPAEVCARVATLPPAARADPIARRVAASRGCR